jgi:hypothetical protein
MMPQNYFNKHNVTNLLAMLSLVCLSAGLGFYFGNKISSNKTEETKKQYITQIAGLDEQISKQKIELEKQIGNNHDSNSTSKNLTKELFGVFWIKVNQEPICPASYTVKGTFKAEGGTYYTADYKSYTRIKPDICFVSEEFARDTAGFIKKF